MFDRIIITEEGLTIFSPLSLPFFLILGHEFTSDAEECVDGPQRGGGTRVPQHEQDFTMDQTLNC